MALKVFILACVSCFMALLIFYVITVVMDLAKNRQRSALESTPNIPCDIGEVPDLLTQMPLCRQQWLDFYSLYEIELISPAAGREQQIEEAIMSSYHHHSYNRSDPLISAESSSLDNAWQDGDDMNFDVPPHDVLVQDNGLVVVNFDDNRPFSVYCPKETTYVHFLCGSLASIEDAIAAAWEAAWYLANTESSTRDFKIRIIENSARTDVWVKAKELS